MPWLTENKRIYLKDFLNLVTLYHSLIICVFPVYFLIYEAKKC